MIFRLLLQEKLNKCLSKIAQSDHTAPFYTFVPKSPWAENADRKRSVGGWSLDQQKTISSSTFLNVLKWK